MIKIFMGKKENLIQDRREKNKKFLRKREFRIRI
jgi:hypothetical protein